MTTPLMRIDEVARLVAVHPRTVQRWVRDGEFPRPIKLPGGQVRWQREAVDRWLAQRAREVA